MEVPGGKESSSLLALGVGIQCGAFVIPRGVFQSVMEARVG